MNRVAPDTTLEAINLHVVLDGTTIIQDLTVGFSTGRWTAIVGPNGAGKSTLLKVLAGLVKHSGQVFLDGRPFTHYLARDRARRIAWLGQHEGASDDLSVYDIVMLGRLPHQSWMALPSDEDHHQVRQSLDTMQAWAWRDKPLSHLSGGERQRVLIARALAVNAQVLLMDEPLINLDPPHQADWLQLVKALTAQGTTVITVLHEISMALQSDDMLVINRGGVAHQGAASQADTHRAIEAVFDNRLRIHPVNGQWVALSC